MSKLSEADVIKSIDEQLTAIDDPAARQRILRWAAEKFASNTLLTTAPPISAASATQSTPAKSGKRKTKKVGKTSTAGSLSIVKDLNLKPSGKKSFSDFVSAKQPSSNAEKCLVAVHYLTNVLGVKAGANHVFTCFKVQGWRVPANLPNALQWTASQPGWLDTRNMSDIKVTTHGDNHVEHDMPKKIVAVKRS
jgi:hypothetical protein